MDDEDALKPQSFATSLPKAHRSPLAWQNRLGPRLVTFQQLRRSGLAAPVAKMCSPDFLLPRSLSAVFFAGKQERSFMVSSSDSLPHHSSGPVAILYAMSNLGNFSDSRGLS